MAPTCKIEGVRERPDEKPRSEEAVRFDGAPWRCALAVRPDALGGTVVLGDGEGANETRSTVKEQCTTWATGPSWCITGPTAVAFGLVLCTAFAVYAACKNTKQTIGLYKPLRPRTGVVHGLQVAGGLLLRVATSAVAMCSWY